MGSSPRRSNMRQASSVSGSIELHAFRSLVAEGCFARPHFMDMMRFLNSLSKKTRLGS